ncbi:hypothetical protein [Prosthecobacter sp.]|uniref:hypothetical protein n=1 Tax=Prosthecobacter sp. TaxID=1965333 RepID=UPI0037831CBD
MMNAPRTGWTRWLLAAWEGLSFGWFLLIAHVAAGNLIEISEYIWHPKPADLQAPLTLWLRALLPEETWSLLLGGLAFSVGFGLISFASHESPMSRLFRWTVIAVFTVLVVVAQPAMDAFRLLLEPKDDRLWDEILFVALALTVLVYGILRCLRASQAHAHETLP